MNNFDSNRAIHGDMINYVVLGKDDKLLNMNSARSQPENRLSAMTTNSIRTTGKCSNGEGISSVPFGPSFGAFIFALVALLAAARSNPAAAEDQGAIPIRARTACMVGHQFEPGPIVGVATANRPFVNFKRGSRSCGNSSKETPTAAPERRPTSTAALSSDQSRGGDTSSHNKALAQL